MRRIRLVVIASVLQSPALLAAPQPVVPDKVIDRFVPFPYESQKIGGLLGGRIRINLEKRLLQVDEPALMKGFEQRPGAQAWIGEHVGKYLDAASNTWLMTRDERLKQQMDRLVNRLLGTQLEDGYLGTYVDAERWTSWDVWVHKYNILGLLAYYRATGDERSLKAARRMGDLLASTFGEGKRDIIASSTHVGMAATSVLEAVVQLYRYTGEPRYLAFAEYLVRSWEQPNGPKLVSSLTQAGNVFKTANGKAYEMMSDLVGVLELYRVTANPTYLTMATNAWKDITARRLYITGTVSAHEHFQDDFVLPGQPANDTGEGCATVTWLQLNWQLLRLTGEAKYAGELERTVYNQLLAAQDPRTGLICYFTPLNGRKEPRTNVNCCQSSEPRGISMIPQLTWGSLNGGVAIELFTDGEANVPVNGVDLRLAVATTYPDTGVVTIKVDPGRPVRFPLALRIPSWTREASAEVPGKTVRGKAGEYLVLDREWKAGDRVIVRLEMTVQTLDGGKSYPEHIAVQRGPEVLALDKTMNPQVPWLHLAALRSVPDRLLPTDRTYELPGKIANPGKNRTETVKLKMIPFSEATDYRIWLPPIGSLNLGQPAVTAFGKESFSSRGDGGFGSITDERPETWLRTRESKPGGSDWWAVEIAKPATISKIVFRHGNAADDGGWFDTSNGKPEVQVKRTTGGSWETVGRLETYPSADGRSLPGIQPGQPFEFPLPQPVEAVGIRVLGKPAGKYSTCAELGGYR